mgnify:FL=1
MIYTCTMNLAIDLFIKTAQMLPSEVNRTDEAVYMPNGKGVNVSFILKELGIDSTATGFKAGFTGQFIEEELQKAGIQTQFVTVDGITRINVFTQVVATNEEFKLVNQGPSVTPDQEASLLAIVENMNVDDILFVSGSHPEGITRATYENIAKESQKRGFKFILDTSASFVPELLGYKPYLIKPNDEELAEWFGLKDISLEKIKECGRKLLEQGAQNIIVSLGDKGAILFTPTETIHVTAPKGEVVNTACAGDTLLATFVGSKLQGLSDEEALIKAVAAGSSTAFRPGLTDFKDVPTLMQQIKRVS